MTDPLLIGRWGWDLLFFDTLAVLLSIAAIVLLIRARLWPFAAYLTIYAAMTFASLGVWVFMRHLATAPPFFLALATIKSPVIRQMLLAAFAALGALTVALGASGYMPAWA